MTPAPFPALVDVVNILTGIAAIVLTLLTIFGLTIMTLRLFFKGQSEHRGPGPEGLRGWWITLCLALLSVIFFALYRVGR